jgi:hypothetical protein
LNTEKWSVNFQMNIAQRETLEQKVDRRVGVIPEVKIVGSKGPLTFL